MTGSDIRYHRHVALPGIGEQGQQILRSAKVAIIGLGGLGSVAALYLANAGTGRLLLNDFDRVDASNLPRQILFRAADVGELKAVATARALAELNPEVQTSVLDQRLDTSSLQSAIRDCDAVLDCSDNFSTRVQINAACLAERRALISGAAIRFEGQVTVFRHDLGSGPCYRCLWREEDENLADCAGQGILAPVAGTVGTLLATETLKLLLGLGSALSGRLWVYDGLAGTTRIIRFGQRSDCPACGGASRSASELVRE